MKNELIYFVNYDSFKSYQNIMLLSIDAIII